MSAMAGAVLAYNREDMMLLVQAVRKGNPDLNADRTDEEMIHFLKPHQLKEYVRRITRGVEETASVVEATSAELKGPAGLDIDGIHLFKFLDAVDAHWWRELDGGWVLKNASARARPLVFAPASKDGYPGWWFKQNWKGKSRRLYIVPMQTTLSVEPLPVTAQINLSVKIARVSVDGYTCAVGVIAILPELFWDLSREHMEDNNIGKGQMVQACHHKAVDKRQLCFLHPDSDVDEHHKKHAKDEIGRSKQTSALLIPGMDESTLEKAEEEGPTCEAEGKDGPRGRRVRQVKPRGRQVKPRGRLVKPRGRQVKPRGRQVKPRGRQAKQYFTFTSRYTRGFGRVLEVDSTSPCIREIIDGDHRLEAQRKALIEATAQQREMFSQRKVDLYVGLLA
ncbi:Hypp6136 [Branchiostoma lanceolatum]|uniref:Hypp6136 protein n=1 Tax=Branchiostoma lanceolatum TaxID=7740 RepID=A0A8J9YRV7_BRALA|nr:Hypp6136 [Branchiostoma lanceolatum]